MNERMNGKTNGKIEEQAKAIKPISERNNGKQKTRIDERKSKQRTVEPTNERTSERKDGWMD